MRAALAVIAAVALGGPFGSASGELIDRETTVMTIDLEVEVKVSVQAVVAHLSFDRVTERKLPLRHRGNGVFGITTELPPRNYVVVFDAVGPRGGLSEPVTFHELGIDLVSGTGRTTTTIEAVGLTGGTQRAGWLAIAFAAASLSALAVWALGGSDVKDVGSAGAEEV